MAYYYVEATWKPAGARLVVDVEFYRTAASGSPMDADVSLGGLLAEDVALSRRLLGQIRIDDPFEITPLRVRRRAIGWLRDVAGMTGGDVLEMSRATQADIAFLDRLAALTAA